MGEGREKALGAVTYTGLLHVLKSGTAPKSNMNWQRPLWISALPQLHMHTYSCRPTFSLHLDFAQLPGSVQAESKVSTCVGSHPLPPSNLTMRFWFQANLKLQSETPSKPVSFLWLGVKSERNCTFCTLLECSFMGTFQKH